MKRLLGISAIVLLVGAIAVPLMAYGPGGARGGYMMYGRDGNDYAGSYNRGNYANLTTEQREQLDALDKKYYDETNQLRKDLWDKRTELDKVLNTTDPDMDKAKVIQNEISDIQAKLAEKRLEYQVEAQKINPNARYGSAYGRGMMDYGPRDGMKGGYYGPGACWR
ncbi:MAG: Spy/CpxP family protein refolding chaperone [Deltaproteobacteria bacterium]|nr:Spy/CpxP family protein refolding chaperone [Deltaproteobacteria bacterium]